MSKNLMAALALTVASAAAMAKPVEQVVFTLDQVSEDLRTVSQKAVESCYTQASWKLNSRGQYSPEYGEVFKSWTRTKIVKAADDSQGNPEYALFIASGSKSHIITSIGTLAPITFICTAVVKTNAKNLERNLKITEKNEKRIAKGKEPKKLKSVWVTDHAELLETTIYGRTVH